MNTVNYGGLMTEEQIKEHLSNNFVSILAANKSFGMTKPPSDFGVDYQLQKIVSMTLTSGQTRVMQSGNYIDIQLKSTSEGASLFTEYDEEIKYKLEAKSYNDMITRFDSGAITPLVLILFILPTDRNDWVDVADNELRLRKQAYWYVPEAGANLTDNTSRITIRIPKTNILTVDCLDEIYDSYFPSI